MGFGKSVIATSIFTFINRGLCATTDTSITGKVQKWVAENDQRSTTKIFFSCILTLLVCTWTALHLNVPHSREGQIRLLLRKAKWMFITFVAPEFVFGHALAEFTAAWKSRRYMRELAAANNTTWTLTHGFFANQGGFVLQFPDVQSNGGNEGNGDRKVEVSGVDRILARQSDGAGMVDLRALGSPPVNARQICYLAKEGLVHFPKSSLEEIEDKSKGDVFTKGLACWQVLWLLIQCCVREVTHIPTSPLEISTLSFSACALVVYAMWYRKPLDVHVPIPLFIQNLPATALEELKALSTKSIVADFFLVDQLGRNKHAAAFHSRVFNDSYFVDRAYVVRFPRDVFVMVDWEFGVTVVSMLFGGIHIIGWNFDFPTPVERLLWRITSIYSASIMPTLYLTGTLVTWSALKVAPDWTFRHKDVIFAIPIAGTALVYSLGRLYLLGESFASLRSLPQGVFKGTWAANLPSVN